MRSVQNGTQTCKRARGAAGHHDLQFELTIEHRKRNFLIFPSNTCLKIQVCRLLL